MIFKGPVKSIEKNRYIVFFDICSSTNILENLLFHNRLQKWRSVIRHLRDELVSMEEARLIDVYKFQGDGWVLLVDPDKIGGGKLMDILAKIAMHYRIAYDEHIEEIITCDIEHIGVTFGIDRGNIYPMVMNKRYEWIGISLNIASRLQGAVKKNIHGNLIAHANRVLISKPAFSDLSIPEKNNYNVEHVTRSLAGIANGTNFRCVKMNLNKQINKFRGQYAFDKMRDYMKEHEERI